MPDDSSRPVALLVLDGNELVAYAHGGALREIPVELDERTRETVRQALLAVLDAANEQESR